jgi:hypothetical protein
MPMESQVFIAILVIANAPLNPHSEKLVHRWVGAWSYNKCKKTHTNYSGKFVGGKTHCEFIQLLGAS